MYEDYAYGWSSEGSGARDKGKLLQSLLNGRSSLAFKDSLSKKSPKWA